MIYVVHMEKVIAVHSFKGGTGKSFVAANLALTYASKGKNVCILDFDFRAPSLGTTFPEAVPEYTTNDYLDGYCKPEEMLVDISSQYATRGKLLVGLASHSADRIQQFMVRGITWGMKALQHLHTLKKALTNHFGIDYVFMDASPGVQYTTVNAIVASDAVLVVATWDESDIEGIKGMIESIYRPLGKKVILLLNKFPTKSHSDTKKDEIEKICEMSKPLVTPVEGTIPCSCEAIRFRRSPVFIRENPNHPITKAIEELSLRLIEAF